MNNKINDQLEQFESYSIREAREKFSTIISDVAGARERILLKKHNKAIAGIVSLEDIITLENVESEELTAFAAQHKNNSDEESQEGVSTTEILSKYPEIKTEDESDISEKLNSLLEENRHLRIKIDRLESKLAEKSRPAIEMIGELLEPAIHNKAGFRGSLRVHSNNPALAKAIAGGVMSSEGYRAKLKK
jgi:PHD/YefM family antitoxin component YafN of YafNO toxin-antitoxin module